jgi:hypothetical protein
MKYRIHHKHPFQRIIVLSSYLLVLTVLACGPDKGTFRIEGEFKGFNQGEFYVYSPDGGIRELDTIAVKNGKFIYQTSLDTTATFVLVFPNFSEIPVMGASGATAEIEGDAAHLKEIEVKGTKENELMTGFRLKVSEMTPPETVKEAIIFIKEHPTSPVSLYLLNKYFIQTPQQDYQQAHALAKIMQKEAPDNSKLALLTKQLEGLKDLKDNGRLPKFTGTDIKGKPISSGDLYAKINVITTWATWNYESQNIQRQLRRLEKEYGANKLKIVSFCLDADPKQCRKHMDRDSITWCNICDERMWENPTLMKLGLFKVPDNIITDGQGKIIAHSLPVNELNKKIDEYLK